MRLSGTLPALLIGLTCAIPTIALPASFIYPFVTPKVYLLRSLVLVLLAVWGTTLLAGRKVGLRLTPITVAVGLYLLSHALSTLLGVDPYRSVWGGYERLTGLFTLLHFGALYAAATTLIRSSGTWRWILVAFLTSATIVFAVAVGQKIDPELLENRGWSRVSSTLGNPTFLGGFAAFVAVTCVYVLARSRRRVIRLLAALLCTLSLLALLFSETRSALVGLGCGLTTLAVAYLLILPPGRPRRVLVGVTALAIAGSTVLLAVRQSSWVDEVPGLRRLAAVTLTKGSARVRLFTWEIGAEAGLEKPLLGWGTANYTYAFNKFYQPNLLRGGFENTWGDNAHNGILHAFAEQGLPGAAAYLALLVVPLVLLWRAHSRRLVNPHVAACGSSLLVTHFVNQLFLFDDISSLLSLMLLLAFLNAHLSAAVDASPPATTPAPGERRKATVMAGGALLGATALAAIWITNVQPTLANRTGHRALRAAYALDAAQAVEHLSQLPQARSPHTAGVRELFASAVLATSGQYVQKGMREELKELLLRAYDELEANRSLHPLNIRTVIRRAKIANTLASVFQHLDLVEPTVQELLETTDLSPRRQELRFVLAALQLQLGDSQGAQQNLEQAIAADATVAEGWWRLALTKRVLGREEEGRRLIQTADLLGVRFAAKDEALVESFRKAPNPR